MSKKVEVLVALGVLVKLEVVELRQLFSPVPGGLAIFSTNYSTNQGESRKLNIRDICEPSARMTERKWCVKNLPSSHLLPGGWPGPIHVLGHQSPAARIH